MLQLSILLAALPFLQDAVLPPLEPRVLYETGRLFGIEFSPEEIELMLPSVGDQLDSAARMRAIELDNSVPMALIFDPLAGSIEWRQAEVKSTWAPLSEIPERPAELEQLAFADIATLSALLHAGRISSVELTKMYLGRLERLDASLHCAITIMREPALARAAELDLELKAGKSRGPLHGIPYGAKDLLAARGAPTTWGAMPFKDQVLEYDATVITKLDQAGAVLIAKLALGALAWGDVWFAETTRNPWNPEQGSSGSSAGSASATSAGCVAFAIGSETLGSIVSPSARCGTSSLRPTFGRVSRHGAMTLSWSMDKLGPMCRSAQDAALVFEAIQGPDPQDPCSVDYPFQAPGSVSVEGWRVGYDPRLFAASAAHAHVLEELQALGVELVKRELPSFPAPDLLSILYAEAATAFDELSRSGRDDQMVRQVGDAWPNVFRAAQLIPAVEYIRANRLRSLLMLEMDTCMSDLDLYVHPSLAGAGLYISNLTGHPIVTMPDGFTQQGSPTSITFMGQLYGEERLLALAAAWQKATDYEDRHPQLK